MTSDENPCAPAIALRDVSKRYRRIEERSLVHRVRHPRRKPPADLLAVRNVDLQIGQAETVGIIGRNGAGKSTMLRLLAGVSQPTNGCLAIRGRIAPLLSVGVGFHQEMSGRENVRVNGMLLGLTSLQIQDRFADIIDFAGLGDFVDMPVKFYSSGMFMRLGFSIAMHVDPDVLLVDEVLAVGDAGFQLRCLDRMRELTQSGTTTVFVSHSMPAINLLCPRVVVLEGGRVAFDGPTEAGIALYHQLTGAVTSRARNDTAEMVSSLLRTATGAAGGAVTQGEALHYEARLLVRDAVDSPGIHFRVIADDGSMAYGLQTPVGAWSGPRRAGETLDIAVDFVARLGGGGSFHIGLDLLDRDGEVLFSDRGGPVFFVPGRLGVTGVGDLDASIDVDGVERMDHRWTRLDGTTYRHDPMTTPDRGGTP